jgi:hypothetical protein
VSTLLDIEWLLSTLFDASLLTFEPPATAAPFFVLSLPRRSGFVLVGSCIQAAAEGRPATMTEIFAPRVLDIRALAAQC